MTDREPTNGLTPDPRRAERGRPATAPRPCPGCGGERSSFRGAGAAAATEASAVPCLACSLVFIDPIPPGATAAESYGADYYAPWQEREEGPRARLWARRLALVETRQPRGSLLDIGCGDGHFLKVARDTGWSVEGIEFSPEGARRASRRLGRPVAVGDLAASAGLRGPFDVATLWHVLEHLAAPVPMLRAARERLRPGGLLVVAVPNLDNLPMRLAYRVARGRPLPLYEPGAREPHLTHFSPRTLRALLESQGLGRVEIVADRCALSPAKRALDALAAILSLLSGRLLTDAMVAFARRGR